MILTISSVFGFVLAAVILAIGLLKWKKFGFEQKAIAIAVPLIFVIMAMWGTAIAALKVDELKSVTVLGIKLYVN